MENKNTDQYAKACLLFAKRLGLIDDAGMDALKKRCAGENAARKRKLENGETVYGVTSFTVPAYLQYELTRFKLDFVSEAQIVKKSYSYKEITEKEQKAFYKKNKDLFKRYSGDRFTYREVRQIIKKKLREEEYENEISNLLCQCADGQ